MSPKLVTQHKVHLVHNLFEGCIALPWDTLGLKSMNNVVACSLHHGCSRKAKSCSTIECLWTMAMLYFFNNVFRCGVEVQAGSLSVTPPQLA